MRYRRSDVPGASFFFTLNIADRRKNLLVDHVDFLREAMKRVKQNHPFYIDAIVIMPDHLHTVWTLPHNDADFSMRWNLIKGGFSRALPKMENISPGRKMKGERGVWQRRFWEHVIRDDNDYERHVDYIHYNPVKHGYVNKPVEWPFSSIHQFVEKGVINSDWSYENEIVGSYGE